MRHIRTIMLFALPIAFGALLGKYGLNLGLDGSGTNFTWWRRATGAAGQATRT